MAVMGSWCLQGQPSHEVPLYVLKKCLWGKKNDKNLTKKCLLTIFTYFYIIELLFLAIVEIPHIYIKVNLLMGILLADTFSLRYGSVFVPLVVFIAV